MQSPSLSCSDNTSNSSLLTFLSIAPRIAPLRFRSPLFLPAICEIDRLVTNLLILNSYSGFLTGSAESIEIRMLDMIGNFYARFHKVSVLV